MPKYDPPYLKRPLVNAPLPAKPSVANHNAAGPMSISADTLSLEAGAKGIALGNMSNYRCVPVVGRLILAATLMMNCLVAIFI